ncbi:MAG: DUF1343 domain-containing protein [Bacteroidales bacterium]
MYKRYLLMIMLAVSFSCQGLTEDNSRESKSAESRSINCGAEQTGHYVNILRNKTIGVVANHTSRVGEVHLVDTLLALDLDIRKIFAPEHGFRGTADAGEHVEDGKDEKTGLPIISLYGSNRKPTARQLNGLDIVLFDIQDVGARFYTYISTLHYVMEACAESDVSVLILDRPNPNIDVVDGPVLDTSYASFVGMHPVPVAHGMTIAEYARMINGEGWLKAGMKCDLSWVKCDNYSRKMTYSLPVAPSPNLPNQRSIRLYPTLCFFEATSLSVGRGTDMQFQIVGHPALEGKAGFSFMPVPNEGAAHPKHKNKTCYGYDLRENSQRFSFEEGQLQIDWLLDIYQSFPKSVTFFERPGFFDKLAGGNSLRMQIQAGADAESIRKSWQDDLNAFKAMRESYLLYE